MRPETAISLAMLALKSRGEALLGYRSDIVAQLQLLRTAGLELTGIRIRPTVNGESSTEVSDFVGRMAITGLVVQESPIRLTSQGFDALRDHVRGKLNDPKTRDEIETAVRVLQIPVETWNAWMKQDRIAA